MFKKSLLALSTFGLVLAGTGVANAYTNTETCQLNGYDTWRTNAAIINSDEFYSATVTTGAISGDYVNSIVVYLEDSAGNILQGWQNATAGQTQLSIDPYDEVVGHGYKLQIFVSFKVNTRNFTCVPSSPGTLLLRS